MNINWRPLTEHPTDRWVKNDAISNPKLVMYYDFSEKDTRLMWDNYSHVGNRWVITGLLHKPIAWADISIEEFLRQVKSEI